MATTMEQRAKFRELRTSGISRDEAQKQAYGNITPVVSPTPAPDINSDANRIARLQASGRNETADIIKANTTPVAPDPAPVVPTAEVTGVDGQKFTQAPVDPNTGLSTPQQSTTTPIAPAPTAEVKPVATNPVAPTTTAPVKTETVDYTQAQGREQEIMTNLEKFKTQNMTPEQIKNASGYAQATPEKKAIIDGFLNPVKQDSGTIFNTLKMGGSVPASNAPEYRQAQARYNTFRKYTTYDVASLSTAMQGGDLLMGTQAYNDLTSDPTMLAKLQRARAFTNGEVDIVKTGEKMGAYVMSNNPTVAQALSDGSMSQEEYNALTNNAEVETQAKVVSEKKAEYDEYKRQLENISDEVDKEFEGKEVTDSFKSAIKANRDKAIRRLFNSASDEYQNASGLYTELKNSSTQLLALNMEQYKAEQAQQAQIAQEERQIQNQLNLGQAQFEQKVAQQAQQMNTPELAIPSVLEQYAGLGIMAQKSAQEHVAEFQRQNAQNGTTLGQYISQMQKDFQSKPEYKAKFAPKATENFELKEVGGKTYKFNQATGQYEVLSGGTSTSTVSPTGTLATATVNGKNIQLDSVASQSLNSVASLLGSGVILGEGHRTTERQAQLYEAYKNGTGGLAAPPGQSKHESGMAIDIYSGKDKNGKLLALTPEQVKIMNANGWVQNAGADDMGHFEYVGTQGIGTQGTKYTDQNINDLAYLTELQEKNPTQAAKDMKELGYTARDLANYKSGNVPLTEKQKNSSTDILSAITDLVDGSRYEWNDAVGKFDPTRFIGTQDAVDAEVAINNLIAKLTLPNLGVLKGPMSDRDIQFIKEASSKLATNQSNKSFERNLIDAYNLAARRAGKPEIQELSDISKSPEQQPVQPQENTNTGTDRQAQIDAIKARASNQ